MSEAFAANSLDLLHYFERRVNPSEDAADLLSETMLIAWRKVGSLPIEPEAARMWLFTTARYTLLNYQRGKRRQNELAQALRQELISAHLTGPSNNAKTADDLVDLVRGLPEQLAEIIRLVHWDRFTVDETAQLLHLSRATGRRRYNDAIKAVREQLDAPRGDRKIEVDTTRRTAERDVRAVV